MSRTVVIAEAGVNHNGDLAMAMELVDAAAAAGADMVKFQTFKADRLTTRGAGKARYQMAGDAAERQQEMLRRLELGRDDHLRLVAHCRARGIAFLSTPFEVESLRLLTRDFGLGTLKISSGDLTDAPFLLEVAASGCEVVISTGMATLGEVERALGVLAFGYLGGAVAPSPAAFAAAWASRRGRELARARTTVLHCSSQYPTPPEDVNLRAMETIAAAFGVRVGYSDHTRGIAVALAAVARGATMIEKHFTLSRALPGPDHAASLEPDELAALTRGVREVEAALGDGLKVPAPGEAETRAVARKSVVAAVDIPRGAVFTPDNLTVKRPGTGLDPMLYWTLLGRVAGRDYAADDLIEL